LKLKCDEPLSNFAFKFNLRHYTKVQRAGAPKATVSVAIGRVAVDGVVLVGVIVHAELFDDDRGTGMIGSVEGTVEVKVAAGLGGAVLVEPC